MLSPHTLPTPLLTTVAELTHLPAFWETFALESKRAPNAGVSVSKKRVVLVRVNNVYDAVGNGAAIEKPTVG